MILSKSLFHLCQYYNTLRIYGKYFAVVMIFMLSTAYAVQKSTPEIRKIVPPRLSASNLGQKIICYRPMRHDIPNMSISQLSNKIIAHNYGHGSGGWTLAPGAIAYVNGLLQKSEYAKDLKSDTPITVIGAGVIGLWSAYDLIQKGYNNITIIADRFDGLASNNAGGLFTPPAEDALPEKTALMKTIIVNSYREYAAIAKKQYSDFIDGTFIMPAYFPNEKESHLGPCVEAGVMQPPKNVILDFGNGTTRPMIAYDDGIFINVSKMMENLTSYLKSKNVSFVQGKVKNFAEVKTKYIIDCTGLGAKELDNDSKVVSNQGHLIMLKDQNPEDLKYLVSIALGHGKTKSGQVVNWSFYIHPKQLPSASLDDIGLIGGTYIEGATSATPNEEQFDLIVQRARDFYGIKDGN
ncbi:MAG: FAD-binding oxidoreductase [Rickettsia endosymbiont of Pseudomimeciton antennatum]|nr:FAD-binding oxidoreductase [Rickettsia endosymbiont of Pseudomimeciton antennatum]MCC8398176.1 FAD-binding oxidoreductase [Rickettsia endosymbiont of Labidopullus appendiculatus]